MPDVAAVAGVHVVGYLDRRGRRWEPYSSNGGDACGWTCDGLVYTATAALDQLHGPLTALVTNLDELVAEVGLLREMADRLTADLDQQRHTARMACDEADTLGAQVLHLASRWRLTWHALRLCNQALLGVPHTCPQHGQEWRGDCGRCEYARLVARTLVALRAMDKPLPDPPIPSPPAFGPQPEETR